MVVPSQRAVCSQESTQSPSGEGQLRRGERCIRAGLGQLKPPLYASTRTHPHAQWEKACGSTALLWCTLRPGALDSPVRPQPSCTCPLPQRVPSHLRAETKSRPSSQQGEPVTGSACLGGQLGGLIRLPTLEETLIQLKCPALQKTVIL